MLRIFKIVIVVAALLLAGWLSLRLLVPDGTPDEPAEWEGRVDYDALDQQLAGLSKRPEMAGLAVAVVEEGEVRFVRTYGFADHATGARVTPETVFRWASVSKTATGMLAATLAQEGALDLERPVASWQNSLRLPQAAENRLSLAQLLSHQTGLTKNAYDERLEDGQDPAVIRGDLAAAPLQCPPGRCHTYQNIAFDAVSEIFELDLRQPMSDVIQSRFFQPLGMESAGYGMAGLTSAKDWARPHKFREVRQLKEAYWRVPAAAGVSSNITDFAKWMQAMMGQRQEVLSAEALRLAETRLADTPPLYSGELAAALSDAGYGLGLRSFSYGGQRLFGHSGAVDGFRATMIFDPKTRSGVAVMWNSNWGIPFRIPFAVFDSYHKRRGKDWLDLSDIPLPTPAVGE
jgi:beta-lactamase class C